MDNKQDIFFMKQLVVTLENRQLLKTYRQCGCDVVVLALKDCTFSALYEYTVAEVKDLIVEIHALGMEINVLMDRLFEQHEIEQAQSWMMELIEHGVDGVMFADPALMNLAMEKHVESRMIYRSMTMTTSSLDGQFWMEQGVSSVMISSLLTKDEIVSIAKNVPHTSLVVHGYMVMSVSKRKLLSAYMEAAGKSLDVLNRKHLFLREDHREEKMPVYQTTHCMLIYSDFVQSSFQEMNAFMDAGVERFEIDTVFLEEKMIEDTIRAYRDVLDGKDAKLTEQEYLEQYGSVALSDGYYGQKTIK